MNEKSLISLEVNGLSIKIDHGATLMQAISLAKEETPAICFHEATTPNGLCRICVVEVEGWRTLAPACITQVSEGMKISTESFRVKRARRTILEMLNSSIDLSEAPAIHEQMNLYKVNLDRFPGAVERSSEIIDDNPFYIRDYDKCLLCWRCVQACADDMQFTYALSIGGRGYDSKISTFFEAPLPETTCVFCGNCIGVCPTNALKFKTEFYLEQGLDYDAIRIKRRDEKLRNKKTGASNG